MGENAFKIDKIGLENINNKGYLMKILNYKNYNNIDIVFEDGSIAYNKKYQNFKDGKILKPTGEEGKIFITNESYTVKIIKYFNAHNCTIQFEDGIIKENVSYKALVEGCVRKPVDRLGILVKTNQGYDAKIVEYFSSKNITVLLDNSKIVKNISFNNFIKGNISNSNHKGNHNEGYIGDISGGESLISKEKWRSLISRCYNKNISYNPTYKDVIVCDDWKCFQNFAKWFNENYNSELMQGWHLDKDILAKGNKVYSPETCCFVPVEINSLFKKCNKRGDLPRGVKKVNTVFVAQITKNSNTINLGTFNTPEEAFQAYKTAKEQHIREVADEWKPFIKPEVYETMYNWIVEIID